MTPKQAAFVREYLIDLNATRAAVRAGYSVATAYSAGARLLRNVQVREALDTAQAARATRADVDADMVLAALLREACCDDGPAGKAGRIRALELLGKHLGMFKDRPRADASSELSMYLAESLERMNRLYHPG